VTDEPKSVRGIDFREDDLSGALLPWSNGSPIYVQSGALRLFLLRAKIFDYEVKRIGVGSEFMSSFDGSNIEVVLNPAQQADGQLQIGEFHLPASDKWKLSQC
jgi:hypothetical protein